MSNYLQPHGLQHTSLPCPSPTPGACSKSCPSSQWYHPTISSSVLFLLPSIFPSIRVFTKESVLRIRWPVYWSFTCSISPSNEYSGMISFRVDQFDLLAVQGTLKSLLQYHKFESTISVAPSLLYGPVFTTVKTIALTIWIFVSKVMSMLSDTLSRFVTAFLLRSEHLLISCCCHHLQWFWNLRI